MSINKLFYNDGTLKELTFVLADRSLHKISVLNNVNDITINQNYNSANEISFTVKKEISNTKTNSWDELTDLKIIYIPELDEYYQAKISCTDAAETIKSITLTSLCEAELSQIMLYSIEINTETDILREEYKLPTTFYKPDDITNSLLHRILEKAPHYQIGHVDISLWNIQRSFSIDGMSIYDFLIGDLSNEIKCLFIFDTATRTINVYDTLSYCYDCEKREEFTNSCPHCGSNNIKKSYGNDTGIFISVENLAQEVSIETNADSLKNCFRLKAGDELMTATIKGINPNGSDYIFNFSDDIKKDMPIELTDKLAKYDIDYDDCIQNFKPNISENTEIINSYNNLVDKYNDEKYSSYKYNDDGEKELTKNSYIKIDNNIIGYNKLINVYYDLIDFKLYLESSLMPLILDEEHTSKTELSKLTESNLSPIGLTKVNESTSTSTVEGAIKNYAKVLVYSNFNISVNTLSWDYYGTDEEEYHYGIWSGTITITNYGNKEDIATTDLIRIKVYDNYEDFIHQKIEKNLKKNDEDYGSIFDIFSIKYTEPDTDFINALPYYSLNRLTSFCDAYQSALNILIEVDQASEGADLYNIFYLPYYNRLNSLKNEIEIRNSETKSIDDVTLFVEETKANIQEYLDLKNYLGIDLWKVFNAYRREDTYENSNYISDGLSNSKLISKANEFLTVAKKELFKASNLQYTISATLNNFMTMKEFTPFKDKFVLGNWIRLEANNHIFKLRLINWNLDYSDISSVGVAFSTLEKNENYMSDIKSILDSAKSMSTNYDYIANQAEQSDKTNKIVSNWIENGFNATAQKIIDSDDNNIVIDRNGLLCRSIDDITGAYENTQLRLMNSTLAITDDNWKTVKAAIGKYSTKDPITGEIKEQFGVLAENVVGQFIVGENLRLYSSDSDAIMSFDNNGLILNALNNNSQFKNIFQIQKNGTPILYIDRDGTLIANELKSVNGEFTGTIYGSTININDNFKVDRNGSLVAKNASIIGEIVSGSSININNNFKVSNEGAVEIKKGSINIGDKFIVDDTGKIATLEGGSISTHHLLGDNIDSENVNSENISCNTIKFPYNNEKFVGKLYSGNNFITLCNSKSNYMALSYYLNDNVNETVSYRYMTFDKQNGISPITVNEDAYFTTSIFLKNRSQIYDSTDPRFVIHASNDIWIASNRSGSGQMEIRGDGVHCWNLYTHGAKNRIVNTDNYGSVALNAVESPSCFFEDIGSGILNINGECIITFDPKFMETINTTCKYYVNLTKCGNGDIFVKEKTPNYFVVSGTPNLEFDWSVKVKQRGYETDRMVANSKMTGNISSEVQNEKDLDIIKNNGIDLCWYENYLKTLIQGEQ